MINKNLWHSVIAYISVLANCMVGISETRAPGFEVLRNQRPPCLQCPALFLASTPTNVGLVLWQFISIFRLPPSQDRTEHVIGPCTSTSLPYSRFSLPEKAPEMCVSPGPSSWVLRLLKWPLNLRRAGSLTHSLVTHSLLTKTIQRTANLPALPSLGNSLLPLSQKVPQSNMFLKFEPLRGRFYRMFN